MPVERAIKQRRRIWEESRAKSWDSEPNKKTATKERSVVIINLKPVTIVAGLFWRAIFEKVVEEPQATAAPRAKSAASIVP